MESLALMILTLAESEMPAWQSNIGTLAPSAVDPDLWKELAALLGAVRAGWPAGRVFRQNERPKSERRNHVGIALVYWYWFACTKDIQVAVEHVRAALGLKASKLAASTICRYARTHGAEARRLLDNGARAGARHLQLMLYSLCHVRPIEHVPARKKIELNDNREAFNALRSRLDSMPQLSAAAIADLREYLRKKTARPDV